MTLPYTRIRRVGGIFFTLQARPRLLLSLLLLISFPTSPPQDKVKSSLETYKKYKRTENTYKEEVRKIISTFNSYMTESELKTLLSELSNYTYIEERCLKINGSVTQKALEMMREKASSYLKEVEDKFKSVQQELVEACNQQDLKAPHFNGQRPESLHYILCLDGSSSM